MHPRSAEPTATETMAPPVTGRRRLLFTSAGDYSAVPMWTATADRSYDVWAVYYGDGDGADLHTVDHRVDHKGSKFQNLHWMVQNRPGILDRYDSVAVLDDDLQLEPAGIDRLFDILDEYGLWVLQPAYRTTGRISWRITRMRSWSVLRYTDFVEEGSLFLRRDKLTEFLTQHYDPSHAVFGIDWTMMWALQPPPRRVAIVDEVTCINPDEEQKSGVREIDRMEPDDQVRARWASICAQRGVEPGDLRPTTFGHVRKPAVRAARDAARFAPRFIRYRLRGAGRRAAREARALWGMIRRR